MHPLVQKLNTQILEKKSLLSVGLDPVESKIPDHFHKEKYPFFSFNKWIIDQTHAYAVAYKPNAAFYEAKGAKGWEELEMTAEYLRSQLPDVFTILDAKRADIDSTNEGYVTAAFDHMQFDSITLHPYLGKEAIAPFLSRKDKISIILCRTSNPGAGEFQDLLVDDEPLWLKVAKNVSKEWNTHENCMLVVGATYPEELKRVRATVGKMTILVPGVGAQGGDLEKVLEAGLTKEKMGIIVNSSRGIIYASDPAAEAKKMVDNLESVF
jgi:orotidine-5'-phosphate decarboxylase